MGKVCVCVWEESNLCPHHHKNKPPPQTNTFLEATEQGNEWVSEDFARFFLERRLVPQLMVRAWGAVKVVIVIVHIYV